MAIQDSLGDRMKEYESRNQYFLQKRTPVCIRVDMRAGHTFTKGFIRPFDEVFGNAMIRTMEYCAKNIGNCVFAYCQSDEITFILIDYEKLETDAWFDYSTDKLCSIAASMATMAFNKFFEESVEEWCMENFFLGNEPNYKQWLEPYHIAKNKGAMFDARCFNIPKEEVCNLIYWRQLDATRNSIQMVGQANFSHAELQNKSCNDIQDMLHEQKGVNWNDYPTRWKRGVACYRVKDFDEWGGWEVDYEMPILKGDNRSYVENMIFI
jgi:tRNA(His) 5'-end guanylyltransferase